MLSPASGTGQFIKGAATVIRFARHGCTNRPFYHIVVTQVRSDQHDPVIEQLGSYDDMANQHNEKLVSLNIERLQYWIGNGSTISTPVQMLLGLAGFYPIHPRTYMQAWRNRQKIVKENIDKQNSNVGQVKDA